jgi:hypothetical protein
MAAENLFDTNRVGRYDVLFVTEETCDVLSNINYCQQHAQVIRLLKVK